MTEWRRGTENSGEGEEHACDGRWVEVGRRNIRNWGKPGGGNYAEGCCGDDRGKREGQRGKLSEGRGRIGGVWERAGMGAAVEVMRKAYGRGGEERGDLPIGGRSETSEVTRAGQGTDGNSVEFLA